MKKIPVCRTIALVIAGILFVFGAYMYWASHKIFTQFDVWLEARPVDIEVDFSKAGTYSSKFEQTCSVSHSEFIGLELPKSVFIQSKIQTLLRELKASCIITDSNGSEIVSLDLSAGQIDSDEPYFENLALLNLVHLFKNGTYQLSVTVLNGAPALAGIKQRLIARYQLCGLERMPGIVLRLGSYVCFLAGGVIALITLWISAKRARKAIESPAKRIS